MPKDLVETPLDFIVDDAVMGSGGAQLGATVAAVPFGQITYTWTLVLVPLP